MVASSTTGQPPRGGPSGPLGLLLVDGDTDAPGALAGLLARAGLGGGVRRADGRAEALTRLGGSDAPPVDCVLVAVAGAEPGRAAGHEDVAALAAAAGRAPVVALVAGTACAADEAALLRLGATEVLARAELSPSALSRALHHAIRLRRAEADFDAAEARLLERLDFERRLIGIVSHDLRNPVNAMTLAAASALRHLDRAEQVRAKLVRIQATGERAIKLIGDFLDLTQVQLGGGIPVSCHVACLCRVAREVVDELAQVHPGRRIELAADGDTRGELDADRLAQLLGNLLSNALAYSPADARVQVTVSGRGDTLEVAVHNVGEPIPPALVATLFEPLKRGAHAGNRGRSIGMGLFIVDAIVRAHDGEVLVSSSAAAGTTFCVRLPRRRRAAGQGAR